MRASTQLVVCLVSCSFRIDLAAIGGAHFHFHLPLQSNCTLVQLPSEMHRVLVPGGRAALVVWKHSGFFAVGERVSKELLGDKAPVPFPITRMAYSCADEKQFKQVRFGPS